MFCFILFIELGKSVMNKLRPCSGAERPFFTLSAREFEPAAFKLLAQRAPRLHLPTSKGSPLSERVRVDLGYLTARRNQRQKQHIRIGQCTCNYTG